MEHICVRDFLKVFIYDENGKYVTDLNSSFRSAIDMDSDTEKGELLVETHLMPKDLIRFSSEAIEYDKTDFEEKLYGNDFQELVFDFQAKKCKLVCESLAMNDRTGNYETIQYIFPNAMYQNKLIVEHKNVGDSNIFPLKFTILNFDGKRKMIMRIKR